jgi:Flp pilus assembly protein TadD
MIEDLKDLFSSVIGRPRSSDANPEDPKNLYNEGISLMNKCSYGEAVICFSRAAELDPMDAKVWNNKGICFLSQSRFDDALMCIEKAIEIDPRHAFYWYNKAIELFPKYAEAWFNKATAEESVGNKKEAIDAWRQYLKVAANNKKQKDWIPRAIDRLAELKRI